MIPEIYERFCAINFLRQRKSVCEYIFWGGQKDQIETIIYFLDNSIELLQNEINDIAKYYGNSYRDENGDMVWIESRLRKI